MEEKNVTPEGQTSGANATGQGNSEGQGTDKTYTEKEFLSEVDKRVTEALKTAKGKWQSEYDEKLQAERDEAARLAKLSADERAKAEFQKEREKFDAERTAYQKEKLEYECAKQLAAAKLDVSFAAMLTGADAETTKKNIDAFKTAFDKAVENSVTDRLKGEPPKGGGKESSVDPFLSGLGL